MAYKYTIVVCVPDSATPAPTGTAGGAPTEATVKANLTAQSIDVIFQNHGAFIESVKKSTFTAETQGGGAFDASEKI